MVISALEFKFLIQSCFQHSLNCVRNWTFQQIPVAQVPADIMGCENFTFQLFTEVDVRSSTDGILKMLVQFSHAPPLVLQLVILGSPASPSEVG